MSTSRFEIPEEYQSQLRYVEPKDTRTDEEILKSLEQHVPVTSEKNIWTYWHSGLRNMPSWCQRNIITWVRLHDSTWTVRVLDTIPNSPNHALTWISPSLLPTTFINNTMTGPYTGPHSADFLRGAALHTYGGVWMDVGILLFRTLDSICWDILSSPATPYTISTPWMYAQMTANHFVAARRGDPFIKRWHDLFTHFWADKTDFHDIVASPLIGFVQNLKLAEATARGFAWKYKVDDLTVLGYVGQCLAWIRLAWLQEPPHHVDGEEEEGFDGVKYWAEKVLLFDVLEENWAGEKMVGFRGEDLFSVFTTRRDADPASEAYKNAERTVWRLLTQSSMQKITHGKGLTEDVHCGVLLDDNEGTDMAPGTFGELLRYGSVHFEQTREKIRYVDAPVVESDLIIRKGLFEP